MPRINKKRRAEYSKSYRITHREIISNIQKKFRQTPKGKFIDYRNGAKKRGYEFSLTKDEFESFIGRQCIYCGVKLSTIGIDRKNNKIGYTTENSVPCCSICNFMKNDLSFEIFIEQCHKIYKNTT